MSAGAEIDLLLDKIRNLPKGATFELALASLGQPDPPALQEVRRQCALVRAFDAEVYRELTRDLAQAPAFTDFVAHPLVRPLPGKRWSLDEAMRASLLREWQIDKPAEWQQWNARLAKFFVDRDRDGDRLDALYHLAGSANPDEGLDPFERWYGEADARFDLAQCNALLEILRSQESWRGTRLTRAWHDYRQYYQARQISADDFFKTGAYFERLGPQEAFEKVLAADSREWVFHIHATGGSGKTMFLRWLTSRMLVPRRIPCARIDFDDFPLSSALAYPNQIFARIIDQLAVQVPGSSLTALREKLQRELESPGWNSSVPEEIGRQLLGANLQTNLVVMLDTLEDVTRTEKKWMQACMQALRRLHELHPRLVVVLSGRYDISKLTEALQPGEFVSHELTRFTPEEAEAYLSRRGIPPGEVRDAIVERAGEGVESADDRLAGRNPFKLAMFAELVLNGSVSSADAVRRLPRVDIAYLIQRVIMRIPSQPLRWTIRYGVVARHLNLEFIEAVLLPSLRDALRGKGIDDPNDKISASYGRVWEPDPGLADTVTAAQIWAELKTYARERGWISLVGSEAEGTEELRFHPDVVEPTRELLSGQTIYLDLHRRAAQHFLARSGLDSAQPSAIPAEQAKRQAIEAVFHRFQSDGAAAGNFWRETVGSLNARHGPGIAAVCAAEITGAPYAKGHIEPVEGLLTPQLLREAHCETADMLLQAAHLGYIQPQIEFPRHVEWAMSVAARFELPPVSGYLTAIRNAVSAKHDDAIAILESALKSAAGPRERALMLGVLAWEYHSASQPRACAETLEKLLQVLPVAESMFWPAEAALELLYRTYRQLGNHDGIVRSLVRAHAEIQRSTRGSMVLSWVEVERARYALETGDFANARQAIEGLVQTMSILRREPHQILALQAELMLAMGDAAGVMQLTASVLETVTEAPSDNAAPTRRAELLELRGRAHAQCLQFSDAFNCWEQAGAEYDRLPALDAAARCHLRGTRLAALQVGNINEAIALIDGSVQLRGLNHAEIRVEFQLLRAYTLYRRKLTRQAREVLAGLWKQRDGLRPVAVARIAVFELVFGFARGNGRIGTILDTIAAVQPPSLRAQTLAWCEFSAEELRVPEKSAHALEELFELGVPHEDSALHDDLARVHLLRILGQTQRAAERLSAPPDSGESAQSLLWHWETQRTRLSLGVPTAFRELLAQRTGELSAMPALREAIHAEAALEAVRAQNRDEARAIAQAAAPFASLLSQGESRWIARIREVEHYALAGASPGSHSLEISRYFESLSDLLGSDLITSGGEAVTKSASPPPVMAGALETAPRSPVTAPAPAPAPARRLRLRLQLATSFRSPRTPAMCVAAPTSTSIFRMHCRRASEKPLTALTTPSTSSSLTGRTLPRRCRKCSRAPAHMPTWIGSASSFTRR